MFESSRAGTILSRFRHVDNESRLSWSQGKEIPMNNVIRLQASSLFTPTRISALVALRWLRRAVTMILILANLAITLWATAAR